MIDVSTPLCTCNDAASKVPTRTEPAMDETPLRRTYEETMLECLMPAPRAATARQTVGLDEIARDCARRLATAADTAM